jgi:hypothetical protein
MRLKAKNRQEHYEFLGGQLMMFVPSDRSQVHNPAVSVRDSNACRSAGLGGRGGRTLRFMTSSHASMGGSLVGAPHVAPALFD